MRKIKILGVKIDSLKLEKVLQKIGNFLDDNSSHYIVTTNPEFLVLANNDREFKKILNDADLSLADGLGIILAALLKGKMIRRISGVDLTLEVCKIAEQKNSSVYLLGGFDDIAKKAAQNLKKEFPDLIIAGAERGIVDSSSIDEKNKILERINKLKPAVIFVAFGAPKQEKWISENRAKIPSLRLAMGVGGTFDYLAGEIKRAPKIWRLAGFEWLWRVIIQPWRIFRIMRAVIYFPILFFIKDVLNINSKP